jgi:hypothetical protein
MAAETARKPQRRNRYWERRIRSKDFARNLTALLTEEIASLSRERIGDLLDPKLVRKSIEEWDAKTINQRFLANLVIQANRLIEERLREKNQSLLGLLDRDWGADIESILEEDVVFSKHMEDLVAKMMRQEFVRSLFTDIIYTSIVAFNEKINPLFGGLTMGMVEEQVKRFIRLFMPMVQQRATRFAINATNQRIFLAFSRSIVRELLAEPLPHYFAMVTPGQRKKVERLIRKSIGNSKLQPLAREMTLAIWDDLYKRVKNRKVGELLRLEEQAGWLAERGVEMILPALSRPRILDFVATELDLSRAERP